MVTWRCLLLRTLLLFSLSSQISAFGRDEEERQYSPFWVVHLNEGRPAREIAETMKFEYMGQVGSDGRIHRFRLQDDHTRRKRFAQHHTQRLLEHPQIISASQELILKRAKRDFLEFSDVGLDEDVDHVERNIREELNSDAVKEMFNDPLWEKEWYMHDTRLSNHGPKVDLHVIPVWQKKNITGKNVVVTILDDGLLWTHPDIRANYDPKASFDVNGNDSDPLPRNTRRDTNKHGTRCAGEVAMVANNSLCGVGIAYNAKIGGIRMLDGIVTDSTEASGLSYGVHHIDIYSASWGPTDNGRTMEGPGPLAKIAIKKGITEGRKGRGVIYVWASGNGGAYFDDCSCDGYTSSIYTLAVSSVTVHDRAPRYGELCPSTMATTFSSGFKTTDRVVSTDLHNKCTDKHSGTSASAPLAAGIMALALEANPNLTWRDVQHLVAWTSEFAPLAQNPGWVRNAAGFFVNPRFGFGLMNADAIVEMADPKSFKSVPPKSICRIPWSKKPRKRELTADKALVQEIVSNGCNGNSNEVNFLEHVEINITLSYTNRGALNISLISPDGMRTQLLKQRKQDDSILGIRDWPFMTVHNWGENPRGTWQLVVQDATGFPENYGELTHFELVFHGTKQMPQHMKKALRNQRPYNLEYNSVKNLRSKLARRKMMKVRQAPEKRRKASHFPPTSQRPAPMA